MMPGINVTRAKMRNSELDSLYICTQCFLPIRDWKDAVCYTLAGEEGLPVLHLPYHKECDVEIRVSENIEKNSLWDAAILYDDENGEIGEFIEIPMSAILLAAYNKETNDV